MIYADPRRIGDHGIGRFAREVLSRLDYRPIAIKTNPSAPFDPVLLTYALRNLKAGDVFFNPGYNPPLSCPAPFIFTLHDLNHIESSTTDSPMRRLYYAAFVKRACYRAAYVVTVSEFSRQRILEWSKVSPEKVLNVGNGVGAEFTADGPSDLLPFPYILCVSNRKPHKNEIRQVEAFARSGLDNRIRLVFTGESAPAIQQLIERHGIQHRVCFLGTIPEERLPSIYRGALALLFTSLYEGFGLPVLEAMACGTPIVTSNTTSLPEVAGDAALLVDPTSVEETSAALKRIVDDEALRATMRSRGIVQASKHTWGQTAKLVRDLVYSLLPAWPRE
jgi:glycosyltransferase involved in cell wall biosynthesis